jgi:hypothetical protein
MEELMVKHCSLFLNDLLGLCMWNNGDAVCVVVVVSRDGGWDHCLMESTM